MNRSAIILDVPESTELFAAKLRALVKAWPGNQRQYAEQIGVSPAMLSQYLRGSVPKPATIYKMSVASEVPLAWLLNDDDDRLDPPDVPPSLPEASPKQLTEKLTEHYVMHARHLKELLGRLSASDLEGTAVWVIESRRDDSRPQQVLNVLWDVAAILRLMRELEDYPDFGMYAPHAPTHEDLQDQFARLRDSRPGLYALMEYVSASNFMQHGAHLPTMQWDRFLTQSPVWLARCVAHATLKDDKNYDGIRQRLTTDGYLDKSGKPVEIKDIPLPKR